MVALAVLGDGWSISEGFAIQNDSTMYHGLALLIPTMDLAQGFGTLSAQEPCDTLQKCVTRSSQLSPEWAVTPKTI